MLSAIPGDVITKDRADIIKAAWLKRNGYTEATHPQELKAFLEGMRAMAGEWIGAEKAKDPNRGNHLLTYQPPGDDTDGFMEAFGKYDVEQLKK